MIILHFLLHSYNMYYFYHYRIQKLFYQKSHYVVFVLQLASIDEDSAKEIRVDIINRKKLMTYVEHGVLGVGGLFIAISLLCFIRYKKKKKREIVHRKVITCFVDWMVTPRSQIVRNQLNIFEVVFFIDKLQDCTKNEQLLYSIVFTVLPSLS